MAWCISNAAVKEDENETIRPIKANPKKRIDGVVAAVTALSRPMVLPDRPASPYAHRGVRVVQAAGLLRDGENGTCSQGRGHT